VPTKVIFRADGNSQMGLGHVIRSLALADMLRADFECHFMIRNPLPTLKEQILAVCASIIELPETEAHESESQAIAANYLDGSEIVVLDGYHFRTAYQQILKKKGCKLVCIDDIHAYHFVADVVINHAGGVEASDYSAEPGTRFCLGLDYALLRRPFLQAAKQRDFAEGRDAIFICLGGADPKNDTLKVLQKCEQLPEVPTCYVILGGAYPHRAALERFLEKSSLIVELLSNLNAEEMVRYMQRCSRAITSPSTIAYEYLSVGGELYLHQIADNQVDIFTYFTVEGLAFDFGDFPVQNARLIKTLLQTQGQKMTGQSDKSLLAVFKTLR